MAITFVTGVSGSGKSYYSVYKIYQMFKPEKLKTNFFMQWYRYYVKPLPPKYQYRYVYTNINQFNYDFHPLLLKLDFKLLMKNLTKLRHLAVNKGYTDEELIEVAKELNLYNVLIVLDEAQDYFNKTVDEVQLWWLTYHRHLHQDIHIITQHFDQIDKAYLKNGIYFYRMSPPSLALVSSRFTISYFSCVGMTQKCREKTFTVPYDQNVSKLYVSGDKTDRKSVLKKYIFIFLGIVFFLYAAWAYFNHVRNEVSPLPTHKKNHNKSSNIKSHSSSMYNDSSISEKTYFLHFSCVDDVCTYKQFHIPVEFVLYFLKASNPLFKKTIYHNYSDIDYMLVVDEVSYQMIINSFSDDKKEKKNNDVPSSVALFGGDKK